MRVRTCISLVVYGSIKDCNLQTLFAVLARAKCTVHSISAQTNQEGIKYTKACGLQTQSD